MTTYTSSYKLWKQKCFRIRGVGASSDLLFGSDGNPHFPLFWSLKPHRVPQTPLSLLSEEDRAAVEWLREQDPIKCSALLENEDNPSDLQTLLGNMPPKSQTTKTMDEVAMLKALQDREKKAKAAAAINYASAGNLGTDNNQDEGGNPTSQRKKQKVDEGVNSGALNQNVPPSNNAQNPSSAAVTNLVPMNSDKWWSWFNEFEGATSDVNSIFDRRFTIDQIVEKHLNWKEDRTRVHKAGMKNLGKTSIFRGSNGIFQPMCRPVCGKRREGELEDAKAQVAMQHIAGFDKAVSQLQFLYPDLKVDGVGAFKHIVDGKLFDIVVDEDEE
ncbi:hypothetical protein SESBI_18383 [Sesbania bispinosa]|nr:hypothetical protein SESBI_18383 [Sesbania bispinosa]